MAQSKLKKTIYHAVALCVTSAFVTGAIYGVDALKTLGAVWAWLLVVLGSFSGWLVLAAAVCIEHAEDKELRQTMLKFCRSIVTSYRKRPALIRAIALVNSLTMIGTSVYCGFLVTAIFYSLTVVFVTVVTNVAAAVVDEVDKPKADAPKADAPKAE